MRREFFSVKLWTAIFAIALNCALPARAEEPAAVLAPAQQSELASKLVAGSPWRFETKYEDTLFTFRLTDEGKLQRQSSHNQSWTDLPVTDQRASYRTQNGYTVTFMLDAAGNPVAYHSKHTATFKSVK
ncbi:MAG: hypothetical protein V4578_16005 [Pseudomonadota bacterium]